MWQVRMLRMVNELSFEREFSAELEVNKMKNILYTEEQI